MWLYDFMGFFTLGSLVAIEVLGTIIYPLYVVIIMIYLLFERSDGDFGDEPDLDEDDIFHDPQDIDQEPQNLYDLHQAENITGSTFGPHQKFSRGDDVYAMKEEFCMIKEKKFICSLDILLAVFQARCRTPGCTYCLAKS